MPLFGPPTDAQMEKLKELYAGRMLPMTARSIREWKNLVVDLIGRVADKWTMIILEVLVEHGELRFTQLSRLVTGISQKMLTQTVRQMERDGLLKRKVHPVVPPKVEYKITELGLTLSAAFCGVWLWASDNLQKVDQARRKFDSKVRKATA
jgi:DNA-binding HxlR family transcriptional regulator